MRVNINKDKRKVSVFKITVMDLNTREIGRMVKDKEMV